MFERALKYPNCPYCHLDFPKKNLQVKRNFRINAIALILSTFVRRDCVCLSDGIATGTKGEKPKSLRLQRCMTTPSSSESLSRVTSFVFWYGTIIALTALNFGTTREERNCPTVPVRKFRSSLVELRSPNTASLSLSRECARCSKKIVRLTIDNYL